MQDVITIVGGGLAGSEAAWQAARAGARVRLFEMRPAVPTAAHRTGNLAELVCSNSFKSDEVENAHGLLKAEMRRFGSLVLRCADGARVPAGAALAVDRDAFALAVTRAIESHSRIELVREEMRGIPESGPVILAAGPLVSPALQQAIAEFTGREHLYFFDAVSPIVEADSIDRSIAYPASRYGKGEGTDYLNCPMSQGDYDAFHDALLTAAKADLHDFERDRFFEGCLPIEELALRGRDTLRFGPMKPVGLTDPRTGEIPWAVVQLRQDNLAADHWSLVGFQNQLRFGEQTRIFRMIPGLAEARFVRLGFIHRNTYICSPAVLRATFQAKARLDVFFAGQVSGVEGYLESAASGMLAGWNAARLLRGEETMAPPPDTALGALCRYISEADPARFDPVNISFGLLALPPALPHRRKDRRAAQVRHALATFDRWCTGLETPAPAPSGSDPRQIPSETGSGTVRKPRHAAPSDSA